MGERSKTPEAVQSPATDRSPIRSILEDALADSSWIEEGRAHFERERVHLERERAADARQLQQTTTPLKRPPSDDPELAAVIFHLARLAYETARGWGTRPGGAPHIFRHASRMSRQNPLQARVVITIDGSRHDIFVEPCPSGVLTQEDEGIVDIVELQAASETSAENHHGLRQFVALEVKAEEFAQSCFLAGHNYARQQYQFGKPLPHPTQVIVTMDAQLFEVRIQQLAEGDERSSQDSEDSDGRIAEAMASAAVARQHEVDDSESVESDELYHCIVELLKSGTLALVPLDIKRELKDRLLVAAARAADDHWQPSELFDSNKEDPWDFYCRVYKEKAKPSARRLGVCDSALYNSLATRASRNAELGLPRTADTPHSIHDLFPPLLGPSGRPIRASRRANKLAP